MALRNTDSHDDFALRMRRSPACPVGSPSAGRGPTATGALRAGTFPVWVGIAALLAGLSTLVAAGGCTDFASEPLSTVCDAPEVFGCTDCHGSDGNPAPPKALSGATATSDLGVGAHRQHLTGGAIRAGIPCSECHRVPETLDATGHFGAPPADMTWGPLATAGATKAAWDRDSGTCTNYCHGATLSGGSLVAPKWTQVDGTQAACGTCHGAPPPPPHPQQSECHLCHGETVRPDGTIDIEGGKHIDGVLQALGQGCSDCHGSEDNPAPPSDTQGGDTVALVTVGAHQAHLGASRLRRPIACSECHRVPQTVDAPGHIDASPAEITWGALATTDGASPTWDRDAATCAGTYCHGATLSGGSLTSPVWTLVDGSQIVCGTCHGAPPPPPHPAATNCEMCHPGTLQPSGMPNLDTHIDGQLQVSGNLSCGACHAVPPATGSHLVHFSASTTDATYGGLETTGDIDPSASGYIFNCGNCHPTDPARHGNGVPNAGGGAAEIDLSPVGAPPGSLKARNGAGASYQPGAVVSTDASGMAYTLGTCSEVYCHSARTVETPSGVPVPGVDFSFTGYPITYPAYDVIYDRAYQDVTWGDALSCDGCHGMPPRTEYPLVEGGAGDSHSFIDSYGYEDLHGWAHGGDPIPCSACHYGTVTDPGVRYRDNTPPADGWSVYEPVPIAGYVRHVNGQGDVTFSPQPVNVLSYAKDLLGASYDPATRSCADVSCHHQDTPTTWGTPYRWDNGPECNVCHRY